MDSTPPFSIQSHGVLFVLDDTTLHVSHASANSEALTGTVPFDWLGRPFLERTSAASGADLWALLAPGGPAPSNPFRLVLGMPDPRAFDAFLYRVPGRVLLELLPAGPPFGAGGSFQRAGAIAARLATAGDLDALVRATAVELRGAFGFDRALVLRFEPDGTATAVAEERREGIVDFLGQSFPSGTFPAAPAASARVLTRSVADTAHVPAPLIASLEAADAPPPDLSPAALVSSAPAERALLQRLGARSALLVHLVDRDQSWGLAVCSHELDVLYLTAEARASAELLAELLGAHFALHAVPPSAPAPSFLLESPLVLPERVPEPSPVPVEPPSPPPAKAVESAPAPPSPPSTRAEAVARLAKRMEELIDSLLRYSRAGREPLTVEDVELSPLVTRVLARFDDRLRERRVDVRVPRPLPAVRADRARIAEIYGTLVDNALRYNDQPTPSLELGYDDSDTETITLYVRDNGPGIPDERRHAIFRPFRRSSLREAPGASTGAALAIAKRLVERHGGRLWLDSEPGRGTTFFFTVPPSRAATASEPRAS